MRFRGRSRAKRTKVLIQSPRPFSRFVFHRTPGAIPAPLIPRCTMCGSFCSCCRTRPARPSPTAEKPRFPCLRRELLRAGRITCSLASAPTIQVCTMYTPSSDVQACVSVSPGRPHGASARTHAASAHTGLSRMRGAGMCGRPRFYAILFVLGSALADGFP